MTTDELFPAWCFRSSNGTPFAQVLLLCSCLSFFSLFFHLFQHYKLLLKDRSSRDFKHDNLSLSFKSELCVDLFCYPFVCFLGCQWNSQESSPEKKVLTGAFQMTNDGMYVQKERERERELSIMKLCYHLADFDTLSPRTPFFSWEKVTLAATNEKKKYKYTSTQLKLWLKRIDWRRWA